MTLRWLGFGALLFCLGTGSSLSAQVFDVDECSLPGATISDNATVTDTINVSDTSDIEDNEIFLDITHTWIGDLNITVESPAATTVTLHAGGGGAADDMLLTYTDSGVGNGSDVYTCNCDMQPASGAMADYNGASASGDWTLSVTDNAGGDQGTIVEWCVRLVLAEDALFLRGDVDGNGSVSAITDATALLNWQFNLGAAPPCDDAADVNDDGSISALQDALYLLIWQFAGGTAPPAPGTATCAEDTTQDALRCDVPPAC